MNNKIDFYEATRKAWIIDPVRARKADYVLSIYKGRCYAVFEIHGWRFSSVINGRDRYEFWGKQADSDIEKFYQSKNYKNLWKKGNANPITYAHS